MKKEKLELKYVPGKGSRTYHLRIPNTKDIKGKWGDIKVSGTIDGYKIESKNLAPIKGEDKLLSINDTIRKAINKTGGDTVTVTLYLLKTIEEINELQILETFKESGILDRFNTLPDGVQKTILQEIYSQSTEEKKLRTIIKYIDDLNREN